jgi:predicted nucleic acid-binding Zn ribbon protein
VSRRLAPRPLATALGAVVGEARPAGLLAAVQSAWPPVAGAALAAAATPVSERAGTVTLACESGVWAQELELLAPELATRLNERLEGGAEPGRVERLRFVVGSGANRS